jgi:hypothetical protein
MQSTDLADVAAVCGCWGQTVPSKSLSGPSLHLLRRGWSARGGLPGFSRQGVFFFSSRTCLAWEAHSCCPALPRSPLAGRVCPAYDLPPLALICSCTHALHHTALHPWAACYPLLFIGAADLQARQKLADHPLCFVHLTAP